MADLTTTMEVDSRSFVRGMRQNVREGKRGLRELERENERLNRRLAKQQARGGGGRGGMLGRVRGAAAGGLSAGGFGAASGLLSLGAGGVAIGAAAIAMQTAAEAAQSYEKRFGRVGDSASVFRREMTIATDLLGKRTLTNVNMITQAFGKAKTAGVEALHVPSDAFFNLLDGRGLTGNGMLRSERIRAAMILDLASQRSVLFNRQIMPMELAASGARSSALGYSGQGAIELLRSRQMADRIRFESETIREMFEGGASAADINRAQQAFRDQQSAERLSIKLQQRRDRRAFLDQTTLQSLRPSQYRERIGIERGAAIRSLFERQSALGITGEEASRQLGEVNDRFDYMEQQAAKAYRAIRIEARDSFEFDLKRLKIQDLQAKGLDKEARMMAVRLNFQQKYLKLDQQIELSESERQDIRSRLEKAERRSLALASSSGRFLAPGRSGFAPFVFGAGAAPIGGGNRASPSGPIRGAPGERELQMIYDVLKDSLPTLASAGGF